MGHARYPHATQLLITADGGGSNGYRLRLWKRELQHLANETHLGVSVCHFPPGTSKWNKIEHRLFSFISQNWRGKPLVSHEVCGRRDAMNAALHAGRCKTRNQRTGEKVYKLLPCTPAVTSPLIPDHLPRLARSTTASRSRSPGSYRWLLLFPNASW
jgi:hypothetical protein